MSAAGRLYEQIGTVGEAKMRKGEEDEVKEKTHCVSVLTHSESSPKSRLFGAKQQANGEWHAHGTEGLDRD